MNGRVLDDNRTIDAELIGGLNAIDDAITNLNQPIGCPSGSFASACLSG